MANRFFGISNPRYMLEKAKREFGNMKSHISTDSIFNFFITAYHVKDWVKIQYPTLEPKCKTFLADPDLQMCEYICVKGKHLIATWKPYPFDTQHSKGAVFGEAMFGEVAFGESESYSLIVDGREIDIIALAQRLLAKWEGFFKDNDI